MVRIVRDEEMNLRTEYLRELVAWAKEKAFQEDPLFLVENLAPLVLGVKPSELLSVAINDEKDWEDFKSLFKKQESLNILEVRELNGRLQVIFYEKEMLDSVLSEQAIRDFLVQMSYPQQYTLESYLEILKRRIKTLEFPHEAGVFLGYPLKDVLGFMGLLPLPYRRTQGWRIYGDEELSNQVYAKHTQARGLMRKIADELQ